MKRKWREIKVLLGICAAFGWWGALYPELMLLPDTYRVVMVEDVCRGDACEDSVCKNDTCERGICEECIFTEDACAEEAVGRLYLREREKESPWPISGDVYLDILEADADQIVIKCKLWEDISALIEEWRNGK